MLKINAQNYKIPSFVCLRNRDDNVVINNHCSIFFFLLLNSVPVTAEALCFQVFYLPNPILVDAISQRNRCNGYSVLMQSCSAVTYIYGVITNFNVKVIDHTLSLEVQH